MTIKEVEKKLNITRANIRFYEKEGLLEPKREENEYRNYSNEDLKRLEQILLFRKCNVSIQDIRLIFNGTKSIPEVFKKQILLIENEVKQLEGAKIMCKKLSQEQSLIDTLDMNKYFSLMNQEEERGNKFYNITEDYILAGEKLYQSIIENPKFKGGERMKRGIRIGLYIASAALLFSFLILFDYLLERNIDWSGAIILTTLFTIADTIGIKKYMEKKSGIKFSKKQNRNHFLITILIMILALLGYQFINKIYFEEKEVNSNLLEMSVKKSLIEIANNEYKNNGDYIYAESHKILDFGIKSNKIYVYVAANYGLFSKNNNELNSVDSKKDIFTLIYKGEKNSKGIYELKEYKEGEIPNHLKEKSKVNYDDMFFKEQLNRYNT